MKPFKPHSLHFLSSGLIATVLLSVASGALAQSSATVAAPAAAPAMDEQPAALPLVEAEVRRVDAGAGKITLKHAEIPNLDMPPMTMVFQARETKLLDGVNAGDKVRVTLDKIQGAYTVLSIERMP